MRYLSPEDLIVVHELLIAEFGGLRGITEAGFERLQAAAAAPLASAFGEPIFPDVVSQAAALCQAVIRAHPFSDGNKRVALAALDLFLTDNGHDLVADNDAAYRAMMALAAGTMGRDALIVWVEQHSRERHAPRSEQIEPPPDGVHYLSIEDILDIQAEVAATNINSCAVRTAHALGSALAAPRRSAFGAEIYPTLAGKAGALVYALVQNHPFWDGNKRIAAAALRLFIARNGAELAADTAALMALTKGIALGEARGNDLASWVTEHITPTGHHVTREA